MTHFSRTADREQTFKAFYEAVYPDLLKFAQRRAHPDHAEDVVADAFLVAWRRLDELPREHDDARAWVFGIARNRLLNERRGDQRRRALGVRLADTTPRPPADTPADLIVSRVDLGNAWSVLSQAQQEVLALTVF